ncbi:MAG: FG-GAP-like repeat-containing protein [Terriglobia bacterium]
MNNLGVAYMNQQRYEQALTLFERAYKGNPELLAARLNQGIALLNLQRLEPALAILLEVAQHDPDNLRAWYNLGILYRSSARTEEALEAFDRVAHLDPQDPDTHYFRGLLLAQLERFEESLDAYQRSLALNPFHVSAEFGLARVYHRVGDRAEARQHFRRFEQLKQENLGAPISLLYGEQGRYSLAQQVIPPPGTASPANEVRFVAVGDEAGFDFLDKAGVPGNQTESYEGTLAPLLSPGACYLDYDADGHSDLYLVNSGGSGALYRNTGNGHFENVTQQARIKARHYGMACTAGDYDNDGRIDLALSFFSRVALYRNQGDGAFHEVTDTAFLRNTGRTEVRSNSFPLGLTFVDYDHDGDLDLYVTYFEHVEVTKTGSVSLPVDAPGEPNRLWRNNGNGTFTDWTERAGLTGTGANVSAVATDTNNDRAIDLILTGWQKEPSIFSNPREGHFRELEPWATPVPAPTAGVVVFDFNKDGWMDLAFTHWEAPGLTLWRNHEGRQFEQYPLPAPEWKRGWGLAAVDYDNDGWLDLAAVGEGEERGEIRVLRNLGPDGFEDTTLAVGLATLALEQPRALVTADYDADGDIDLLVTQNGGPVVLLRNEGGNRNAWLRVALQGRADNRSAIGTKVEVFAGTRWQKWEVPAASGYLGQSALEVIAGLGDEDTVEIVRLLWPTGVLQDEIQLAVRARHLVREINRRGSSCPILFVWDGSRFQFVSDVIGAAIVGHWVGPGERNVSDPDEYVRVEGNRVQPRAGLLEFRFMEPMEELIYLDQARLLAVDHPAGVNVYPNEYFASQPPFPAFKVVASRNARPPLAAWDDRGRDILSDLLHRDRRYLAGFELLPFKGFAELHGVELDLGPWETSQPLRLLLHGLTDYFTATSVYAAHQAGVTPIAPYVEALRPDGSWVGVVDDMGFPAGLKRTMVADLTGRLPAGTRRIRIMTNLQIYWDQILIDSTGEETPLRLTEIPLAQAQLRFHGYPRAVEGKPTGDLTYIYEEVSTSGPYARHRGNYTRYGDVLPLLKKVDDQFAIFGPAEEVALGFNPADLPPLPTGWERDYFFFADGFVKDMDFYEAHALTVGPLPHHGMNRYPYAASQAYPTGDSHLSYQLNYNTRQVSGQGQAAFRFDYHPRD